MPNDTAQIKTQAKFPPLIGSELDVLQQAGALFNAKIRNNFADLQVCQVTLDLRFQAKARNNPRLWLHTGDVVVLRQGEDILATFGDARSGESWLTAQLCKVAIEYSRKVSAGITE